MAGEEIKLKKTRFAAPFQAEGASVAAGDGL